MLTLDEEKYLGALAESGRRSCKEFSTAVELPGHEEVVAHGDEALPLFVTVFHIDDEVFADHDNAAGAVVARDRDQVVCGLVNRNYIFADDMVEAKVHLIEGQRFLEDSCAHGAVVCIGVAVVDFKACKLGVLNANVDSDHGESQHVGFVSVERTRNCELILVVAIQNIHKLLLFSRANHNRPTLGICGQELARHDASSPCFAKGLLVHFYKGAFFRIEVEDYDATGVAPHHKEVLFHSNKSEGADRAHYAEDLLGVDDLQRAISVIWCEELEDLAFAHDELVLVGGCEAALD